MSAILVSAAILFALAIISLRAESSLSGRAHLPLSFGPRGPALFAPRRVVLAVSPGLAVLTLGALVLFGPEPATPRVALVGAAFVAAHLWHVRLCRRMG